MSIRELFVDASKFAASDWTKFILLGIIFVDIDFLNRATSEVVTPDYISYLLTLAFIFLIFIESGYLFRIIEASVNGADDLPPYSNLLQLFTHGLKDFTVVAIYMVIPFIVFLISILWILTGDVAGISLQTPLVVLTISIVIAIILFILLQAAILNMAHHNGSFKAAFDYKGIFQKIKNVGLKKFLIVCFLTGIIFIIVEPFILDTLKGSMDSIGGTLMEMILAPYLAILTSRFLGTMDRY